MTTTRRLLVASPVLALWLATAISLIAHAHNTALTVALLLVNLVIALAASYWIQGGRPS